MKKFAEELDLAVERFINAMDAMRKKPRDYNCGELLYPSEIHLIETIGKYPDLNTTQIAERHGVSKGLVSQLTTKLERKGFLQKFQYKENKKEVFFKLTDKGKCAYDGHIEYHKARNMEVYDEFEGYSEKQKELILSFLRKHTEYLKQYDDN